LELVQLFFWNSKFSSATTQADNNIGKYPHDGLVYIFQFGEMDAYLRAEFFLISRPARLTGHNRLPFSGDSAKRDGVIRCWPPGEADHEMVTGARVKRETIH
jgi:hypothetical protein